MPRTHAQIIDLIEEKLQDSSNATWSAAELTDYVRDGLRQISEAFPYFRRETYKLETRTGTATSTSANNLVDATESQFLSTDTDKVIYNTTDKTWAIVTTYTSATTLVLSRDIMASGEQYEIYNKGCWNNRQINISDMRDAYLWIDRVEFEVGDYPPNYRNFDIKDDILEIDIDFTPDDSKDTDADIDVYVYFAEPHRLNRMTDLAGAVNNAGGYTVGATSMALNGLTDADVIVENALFTVATVRGTYRITADVTVASSAATVSFYPGLYDAVVNTDAVTFVGSTLTPRLERMLVDLVYAQAVLNKNITYVNLVNVGGTNAWANFQAKAERDLSRVLSDINAGRKPITKRTYSRG